MKLFKKKNSKIKILEDYLLFCYFVCLCVNVITNDIQRRNKEIMILELYRETEVKKYVEIMPYYAAKTVFCAANFSMK